MLGQAQLGLGSDPPLGLGAGALGLGAVGLGSLDPLLGLAQGLRRLVALGEQLALALARFALDLALQLAPHVVALVAQPLGGLLAGARRR